MPKPLDTPRPFSEILVIVALAEVAVMMIRPVIAPGISHTVEALLDATLLWFLAGAAIF